jgi:hypothetical protein
MTSFLAQNWGNVASVAGLGISIWVLVVARKAKQAAEGARFYARLETIVEDLEEANNKAGFVGVFLRDQKWEVAQLFADEVLSICGSALSRSGDQLRESRKSLIDVSAIMRQIGSHCRTAATKVLTQEEA